MVLLKKMRFLAVLMIVCTFLISTSCTKKSDSSGESTEHPAGEENSEHPAGDAEHPTNESDTTKVEGQK